MVRKLKHHEAKLLKKVDMHHFKRENQLREISVMRRYHVQDRDDYRKYNKIVGETTRLVARILKLEQEDPYRTRVTAKLLDKLYDMGLVPTKSSLIKAKKLTVSAFCRRRLPIVMVRLKMAETNKQAVTYVEQGHIRVGPEVVTDPAFLVPRSLEDHLTWVDSSKIRRAIKTYNDEVDDYDLLNS